MSREGSNVRTLKLGAKHIASAFSLHCSPLIHIYYNMRGHRILPELQQVLARTHQMGPEILTSMSSVVCIYENPLVGSTCVRGSGAGYASCLLYIVLLTDYSVSDNTDNIHVLNDI